MAGEKGENILLKKTAYFLYNAGYARSFRTVLFLLFIAAPGDAFAIQGHFGPEGIFLHQLAHVFFFISLFLVVFWIHKAGLLQDTGWRWIRNGFLLFTAWNFDTFMVHWLSGYVCMRIEPQRIMVSGMVPGVEWRWIDLLYYIGKMDHLLCVPAMAYILAGLRRLAGKEAAE